MKRNSNAVTLLHVICEGRYSIFDANDELKKRVAENAMWLRGEASSPRRGDGGPTFCR